MPDEIELLGKLYTKVAPPYLEYSLEHNQWVLISTYKPVDGEGSHLFLRTLVGEMIHV